MLSAQSVAFCNPPDRYANRVSFKPQPTSVIEGPRDCSIADVLEILGDRWSLLIVRECGYGNRRFNEIQRHTGAPRNILASRLKRMQDVGILHRQIYSEHPQRYEYSLTNSGEELFPILLAFREWGEQQLHGGEPPVNPVWHKCGAELQVETVCGHCHEVVRAEDLHYR
jgi:DNA-binding HxlR family transcriptional regulator